MVKKRNNVINFGVVKKEFDLDPALRWVVDDEKQMFSFLLKKRMPILIDSKPQDKVAGINKNYINMFQNSIEPYFKRALVNHKAKYPDRVINLVMEAPIKDWWTVMAINSQPMSNNNKLICAVAEYNSHFLYKLLKAKAKTNYGHDLRIRMDDTLVRNFINSKAGRLFNTYIYYLQDEAVENNNQVSLSKRLGQLNVYLQENFSAFKTYLLKGNANSSGSSTETSRVMRLIEMYTILNTRMLTALLVDKGGVKDLYSSANGNSDKLESFLLSDEVTHMMNEVVSNGSYELKRLKTISRTAQGKRTKG